MITHQYMDKAVLCQDGCTYENHEIKTWLRDRDMSPIRIRLTCTELFPNHDLRSQTSEFNESGIDFERRPDELFKCPISGELMDDPVMCHDGYSYERREIQARFSRGMYMSLKTNSRLTCTELFENRALRMEIGRYKRYRNLLSPHV